MTSRVIMKSLGTLIREALDARGIPVVPQVRDGRLVYIIDGQALTPGDVAERFGIVWRGTQR